MSEPKSILGNQEASRLDLIEDFYLFLKTNNYSLQTIYHYKSDLLMFDNFLKSRNLFIKDLDKRSVLEFKAYLASNDRKTSFLKEDLRRRLTAASINRCLSAVRAYVRFLIDQDYKCPVIPEFFKMVKRERLHPNVVDFHDLVALIESPSHLEKNTLIGARNRAILETLFSTGMRISELVNLNKLDINDEGRIFITGKGKKQRFVYLTDRAKSHLENYLRLRQDQQKALFIPTRSKTERKGIPQRLTARYIAGKIQKYRGALRIDLPTTPHSFRHGFATYLAEEGASPAAIQILLGHESLNTTTRYVNASDRFAQDTHRKYHPLANSQ